MGVVIAMLRAVNVGGKNKIKMEGLRALFESLKLRGAQTLVQSGNVVFRTEEENMEVLGKRILKGIQKEYGFEPEIILRTASELRNVIAKSPFAKRRGLEPNKLHVHFLVSDPGEEGRKRVAQIQCEPEEMRAEGRELYLYFPNGMGQSKFPWAKVDKALGTRGTARNWNSVTKMMAMADEMENTPATRKD